MIVSLMFDQLAINAGAAVRSSVIDGGALASPALVQAGDFGGPVSLSLTSALNYGGLISVDRVGGFQRFGLNVFAENYGPNPAGLGLSLNEVGFLEVNNNWQVSWGYQAPSPSRAYFELHGGNPIIPGFAIFNPGQAADYEEHVNAAGAVVSRVDPMGAWRGPVIIASPNGTSWQISVDDTGHVTATPVGD
jgi:hypothetical protein